MKRFFLIEIIGKTVVLRSADSETFEPGEAIGAGSTTQATQALKSHLDALIATAGKGGA